MNLTLSSMDDAASDHNPNENLQSFGRKGRPFNDVVRKNTQVRLCANAKKRINALKQLSENQINGAVPNGVVLEAGLLALEQLNDNEIFELIEKAIKGY